MPIHKAQGVIEQGQPNPPVHRQSKVRMPAPPDVNPPSAPDLAAPKPRINPGVIRFKIVGNFSSRSQRRLFKKLYLSFSHTPNHLSLPSPPESFTIHVSIQRATILKECSMSLDDFNPSQQTVLVIGAAGLDIVGRPSQMPEFGASVPAEVRPSFGGVARNIAENLARLGSPFPSSPWGQRPPLASNCWNIPPRPA
jgi:hypothetical protein